jgi:hypothetical protein
MAWIDIKALDGGSLQDFCDNNLQDYEWPTSLLHTTTTKTKARFPPSPGSAITAGKEKESLMQMNR